MIALDTNILAHAHRVDASLHGKAQRVVRDLAEAPTPWCICYHSLIEFYAVVTQSRLWRQASTPDQAMDQIAAWRESPSLRILCDAEAHLDILHTLNTEGQVTGSLVHDARIASCCLAHGITELWTVDRDFSRFPQTENVKPIDLKLPLPGECVGARESWSADFQSASMHEGRQCVEVRGMLVDSWREAG